jgi:hypothetical protein
VLSRKSSCLRLPVQHGMIHLTLVVRKDCDKLIQWCVGIPVSFHSDLASPCVRRDEPSFHAPHHSKSPCRLVGVSPCHTLIPQARQ